MTRFNISLDEGVSMVLWSLENMLGGELFVPKILVIELLTLRRPWSTCGKPIIGMRPGEKIHEEIYIFRQFFYDRSWSFTQYSQVTNRFIYVTKMKIFE